MVKQPSRRVKEALSWRLVAELVRRHPGQLRLIECHGGGGQYDELRLYPCPTRPDAAFSISLNRFGSAHFFKAKPWTTLWSAAVSAEDLTTIVGKLERLGGLADNSTEFTLFESGGFEPDVLTFDAIALLLSVAAFNLESWECRNGYLDSSGDGGSGVRREFFERFPRCRQHLFNHYDNDLLDEPAYRFWFVLRNGEPELAFEDTGKVWDLQGEEIDLVELYERAGSLRRLVGHLELQLPKVP